MLLNLKYNLKLSQIHNHTYDLRSKKSTNLSIPVHNRSRQQN